MSAQPVQAPPSIRTFPVIMGLLLVTGGVLTFVVQFAIGNAERVWQAYLINFLLFSAMAHGALLFSTLMHTVRARWSSPLADLAESFTSFFPISFFLLIGLIWGNHYVFPWVGHDLHGKEVWLNLHFLFSRDLIGLSVLYLFGTLYLYHSLSFKLKGQGADGTIGRWLWQRWQKSSPDPEKYKHRMTVFGLLYMLCFAIVLSLLGYDLVMSMDPHWYSTLFGAYSFIKAIYVGLGALIITAAVLHMSRGNDYHLKASQFHDIGKLFFAFGLVWADFFYAQFVVIWYGNIPEETAYIIERTMTAPWSTLAWTVLAVCFIGPFVILLNKKIKTVPAAMIVICSAVIVGMWLEHFLLLGPVFHRYVKTLPFSWIDGAMALGFLGLLITAINLYLRQFPEVLQARLEENR